MKKMIPIALAGAIAMLICGAALADDMEMGKGDKMNMEQKMLKKQADKLEMMTKNLMLTPDQKDKVGAIIKATGEQKKALMMKTESDEKALRDSESMQIKAVLTPEQQVKYDKQMAEHKAKMEQKKMEKGGKHEMGMEKKP